MARVLVVEDEEQVRVLAAGILDDAGHQVLTAGTVDEARAILDRSEPVDLLFADIRLQASDQGGLEVARDAAASRPGIRIIYTSGGGVTDGTRALFVEGWVFLSKPYTPEALLVAIGNALDQSRGSQPSTR